jgi:hypothetical protein
MVFTPKYIYIYILWAPKKYHHTLRLNWGRLNQKGQGGVTTPEVWLRWSTNANLFLFFSQNKRSLLRILFL